MTTTMLLKLSYTLSSDEAGAGPDGYLSNQKNPHHLGRVLP